MNNPAKELRSLAARVRRRVQRVVYATGNHVECPYCGWTGWRFMPAGRLRRPNRLCPGCSSLERYRMLALVVQRELSGRQSVDVLELAPKVCFGDLCRRNGWNYFSSDLDSPTAMVHGDLRNMPFADNAFDVIACFHVMEHIKDDVPAFAELGRLLKPDGVGIVCVPLRGDVTQEGAPQSEWERLYGQHDHVRYYGMDIEQRMKSAGLASTRIDTLSYFSPAELERYALRGDDRYLFFIRKTVKA